MSDPHQFELEKLKLEGQLRVEQMRQDVRKVVYGTMIVGVAAAFFPFAQQLASSLFAERIASITTQAEYDRLREQNRLAEQLEEKKSSLETARQTATNISARRSYLEQLAGDARSERIERQIVVAEFFSFLAEPDMQPQWTGFRDYLIKKQTSLNEERTKLLASTSNAESADRKIATERLQQIDRLQNPGARGETPSYNLPLPTPAPGESQLGREMLAIAVREINSGIHESNQKERVAEYLRVSGHHVSTRDIGGIGWSAAFIAWVIHSSGNPYQLALSPTTSRIWTSASSKGLTKLMENGPPHIGDILFRAQNAENAKAMRQGASSVSGTAGIVYGSTSEGFQVIAGNQWDAVNLVTWKADDPSLVGFVHLPDPTSPPGTAPGQSSGPAATSRP